MPPEENLPLPPNGTVPSQVSNISTAQSHSDKPDHNTITSGSLTVRERSQQNGQSLDNYAGSDTFSQPIKANSKFWIAFDKGKREKDLDAKVNNTGRERRRREAERRPLNYLNLPKNPSDAFSEIDKKPVTDDFFQTLKI